MTRTAPSSNGHAKNGHTPKNRIAAALVPAVSYIRVSTTKQEASPEEQREAIQQLAEREGFRIVREYKDEGISGGERNKRRQWTQMLADAQSGEFKKILIWDLSRFLRLDSTEAGEIVSPLRRAGVQIVTCTKGPIDWDTTAGRMMFGMESEQANEYLESLSVNVCRSYIRRAREGAIFYTLPLGYAREYRDETGKVQKMPAGLKFKKLPGWTLRAVIDKEGAKVVRLIFELFVNGGLGINTVARKLNADGVPPIRGRAWHGSNVNHVLTNDWYTGRYIFGTRPHGKRYHIGKDGAPVRGKGDHHKKREPLVALDNHHPTIISRELFDAAQAKLAQLRWTKTRRRKSDFPLSGLLRCGHCGAPLTGQSQVKRNWTTRRYVCRAGNNGTCLARTIAADRLERIVVEFLQEQFARPHVEAELRAELHAYGREQAQGNRPAEVRERLAKAEDQIKRATDRYLDLDGTAAEHARARIDEWTSKRDALKAELEALGATETLTPAKIDAMVNKAMRELERLHERLRDPDPAKLKAALETVLERVVVEWHPRPEGTTLHRLKLVAITHREPPVLENRGYLKNSKGANSVLQVSRLTFPYADMPTDDVLRAVQAVGIIHRGGALPTAAMVASSLHRSRDVAGALLLAAHKAGQLQRAGSRFWLPKGAALPDTTPCGKPLRTRDYSPMRGRAGKYHPRRKRKPR